MSWNTRQLAAKALKAFTFAPILSFAVAAIMIVLWATHRMDMAAVTQKALFIQCLNDRKANVGIAAAKELELYQQYVIECRDDVDGLRDTIAEYRADIDKRFEVLNSKLEQLSNALDAERKHNTARWQSIRTECGRRCGP